MAVDRSVLETVLRPPTGAHVERDLVYRTDRSRVLTLDVYRSSSPRAASPVVFLVSGVAPEEVIARAKGWGVFRSYGEHRAARGLAGVSFNHRSAERMESLEAAVDVRAGVRFVGSHAAKL